MNIEIANRLVELRKKNNLSQEALAEKLGISRQAVSKWERSEASPDMDNLIMLARIYHVSLDELVRTEEEISVLRQEQDHVYGELSSGEEGSFGQEDLTGGGIFSKGGSLPAGGDSAMVVCENPGSTAMSAWATFVKGLPLGTITVGTYLVIGCLWDLWHPGWLLFLLLPVLDSLARAVRKKNAKYFAYPALVVFVYMILGIYMDLWHPGWLIFLTIPLYYPLLNHIQRLIREQERELGL